MVNIFYSASQDPVLICKIRPNTATAVYCMASHAANLVQGLAFFNISCLGQNGHIIGVDKVGCIFLILFNGNGSSGHFIAKFHILSVTIKYMIVCHIPKSKNYSGIERIQPPWRELVIQFFYTVIIMVKLKIPLLRLGIFHLGKPAFKT